MIMNRLLCALLCGFFSLGAGACARVKPWERGQLARPVMDPSRDTLGLAMARHMYFSREAASGGEGVGGGGCGCN
jgi:hypothetical protein